MSADLLFGLASILFGVHRIAKYYRRRRLELACPGDDPRCKLVAGGPIERRAAIIAEMIRRGSLDPRVREAALQALTERCGDQWCIRPKDYAAEVERLAELVQSDDPEMRRRLQAAEGAFHYVRRNVRYTRDHVTHDTFQAPHRTLQYRAGDCDDQTILLGSLLRAVGIPVKLRIYWLRSTGKPGHIALRANVGRGRWITLDPTVDRIRVGGRKRPIAPGWEADETLVSSYRDYDV